MSFLITQLIQEKTFWNEKFEKKKNVDIFGNGPLNANWLTYFSHYEIGSSQILEIAFILFPFSVKSKSMLEGSIPNAQWYDMVYTHCITFLCITLVPSFSTFT